MLTKNKKNDLYFVLNIAIILIKGDDRMKTLIVVDMQNDFVDGTLGTKEAVAIVRNMKKKDIK